MKFLQTKWMAIALGAIIYLVMTWVFLQPQKQLARIAEQAKKPEKAKLVLPSGPSWNYDNPEVNQLLTELADQREALRVRSTQLDELEARLKAERQEIYSVTQAVYQLRTNVESTLTRITEEETVNLKKLVKVYSTMSPEGAARILKEMEDDQVVKILALMRETETAPILENMGQGGREDARRTALISDRLRLIAASNSQKKNAKP